MMTDKNSSQPCSSGLSSLFPSSSQWLSIESVPSNFELHKEEKTLTSRMKNKRLSDFRASRYCAKQILEKFGIHNYPLLINEHRAPIWPNQLVGSLSHTKNFCFGVIARGLDIKAIGIDVEVNKPLKDDLLKLICTAKDQNYFKLYSSPNHAATIIFSIKESIFKCLHPIYKKWIDFKEVDVILNEQEGTYCAIPSDPINSYFGLNEINGKWCTDERFVYTSCWLNE